MGQSKVIVKAGPDRDRIHIIGQTAHIHRRAGGRGMNLRIAESISQSYAITAGIDGWEAARC